MNKISKKIVALVTMAAFVLTLVPFAAFGAVESSVKVDSATQNVTITDSGKAEAKIILHVGSGDANTNPIYVWLTKDGSNDIYRYAEYTGGDTNNSTGELKNAAVITKATADKEKDITLTVKIPQAGEYTVHAGIANSTGSKTDRGELSSITTVADQGTITVNAADVYVNKMTVSNAKEETESKEGTLEYGVTPNSVYSLPVVVNVESVYSSTDDGTPSSEGQVVSIDNGNNAAKGVYVVDPKTGEEITEATVGAATSDGKYQAKFNVKAETGTKSGNYYIYLSAGKVEYKLTVVVGTSTVQSIETVDNTTNVVKNTGFDFDGVAEFVFKDANGNEVAAPTEFTSPTTASNNFAVLSQPDATTNKLVASDLKLEQNKDKDAYKLVISNHASLNVGEYTIRVALSDGSGDYADVTFNVAKPGKATSVVIEMDNNAETIVSGEAVEGTVYTVDENGIKTPASSTDVKLGFVNSTAVNSTGTNVTTLTEGRFKVVAKSDEKYIGSKITLFAFDEAAKAQDTVELTVVDGLSNNTLVFDNENGSVAKDNTVNVSVVDENGKVVNVEGKLYAYVESTSNEDAKVDVSNEVDVKAGKAKLTVFSNVETTADIVVAVKDKDSNAIYANTLTYTFGEEDIAADTSIVMTIGSNDFVVNNDVVTVEDAAPYIANNRTYVPFRALGEAIGADVVWDNDARTVTYTLGKTEVVMTIGETTYTVNGEEKTMDVAPEITGERTYVPVRFVGEALGFKVTALSAADGTTASVVFQK